MWKRDFPGKSFRLSSFLPNTSAPHLISLGTCCRPSAPAGSPAHLPRLHLPRPCRRRWSNQMCDAEQWVWCFLGDPVEKIHNPKKVGLKIESSWLSHRHQVLKGTVSSRSHPPAEHKQLKGYGKHSPGPVPGAKWRSPSNPEIRREHLQQKHELCCFWRRLASDCTLV